MTELAPCPRCKRHVAVRETACPFCDAPNTSSASPPVMLVGRWSRAAIFASATTLMGCHPASVTNAKKDSNDPKLAAAPPPSDAPSPDASPDGPSPDAAPPEVRTGTIRGILRDRNGTVLGHKTIALSSPSVNRTTLTNARGEYEFADLAPGTYVVTFEMPSNPRQGPNRQRAEVVANAVVQLDGVMFSLPFDRSSCCKPYGAPPARRRVV